MTSESDTELVERVSRAIYDRNSTHKDADLIRLFDLARRGAESADTITALRAENEKLRAALEPLACTCDRPNGAACSRSEVDCPFWNARATLEEKQ